MSGHDPNPIVFKNKKIKIRRPEHSLNPNILHPKHLVFALPPFQPYPPSPLKLDVIYVSPLMKVTISADVIVSYRVIIGISGCRSR